MPVEHKRGRLSPDEKRFIQEYADTRTDKWIAEQLNRNEETVRKYRLEYVGVGEGTTVRDIKKIQTKYELKKKVYWEELKRQFDPGEIIRLQDHWADLIDQFNNDVTPSEEMQILSVCKLQLLVDRNLCEQKATRSDIQRLSSELEREVMAGGDEEVVRNLEKVIMSYKISAKELTKEYAILNKEQQDLWNRLKATREKRIQVLNDSKSTWNALMQALLDEDLRKSEGRQMAVMKAATDKEYKRLAQFHEFPNQTVDRPFLTPETTVMEDEE